MDYADLAPLVQVSALGAPRPIVLLKIAEAAEEFFRLTRAYEILQGPSSLVVNAKTVALSVPTDTRFLEVKSVRLGGKKIKFLVEDQFIRDWETVTGTPTNYKVESKAIRLVPYPITSVPETLRVRFSVVPLLTARSIPDDLGEQYQAALMHGARAKLLADPKSEWGDAAKAAIEGDEFQRLINETRILVRNEGSQEVDIHVRTRFV